MIEAGVHINSVERQPHRNGGVDAHHHERAKLANRWPVSVGSSDQLAIVANGLAFVVDATAQRMMDLTLDQAGR